MLLGRTATSVGEQLSSSPPHYGVPVSSLIGLSRSALRRESELPRIKPPAEGCRTNRSGQHRCCVGPPIPGRSSWVPDYAHATPPTELRSTNRCGSGARGGVLSRWWLGDLPGLVFRLGRLRTAAGEHRDFDVRDGALLGWVTSLGTLRHLARVDCGLGWRVADVAPFVAARQSERRILLLILVGARES